jgi:GNAT superfamily N-acetyltransferase
VNVVHVGSRRDLKEFIELPYEKYADHPVWVPPLRVDEWAQFNPKKNPALEHLEIDLFLARDDGKIVGRVGAIINHRHDDLYGKDVAFFGFFEARDQETAAALLNRVEDWAKEHRRGLIRGPVNPTLNDPCGFQIDAFDSLPYLLTPYSPAEYVDYMEYLGFDKAKDLLAWRVDLVNADWSRLARISERIKRRANIKIRQLDLTRFEQEADTILRIYRASWEHNWGFVAPTDAEFRTAANQMKMILKPSLVRFGDIDGESVAFSVTLPDINQVLKKLNGRLFPTGLIRLLLGRRKISRVRMPLLGVLPEYRKLGIFAPLITESIQSARTFGFTEGECSWTLEDNSDISRAIQATGGTVYKTFRLFQKQV